MRSRQFMLININRFACPALPGPAILFGPPSSWINVERPNPSAIPAIMLFIGRFRWLRFNGCLRLPQWLLDISHMGGQSGQSLHVADCMQRVTMGVVVGSGRWAVGGGRWSGAMFKWADTLLLSSQGSGLRIGLSG
uniref:HDC17351 n=1 Tax=Drosophila melanogaster TaxID=7227 RepID=Q6IIQ4_DROME|nr:TPA_inf: HDC17351 [Drosophila melanogaster]